MSAAIEALADDIDFIIEALIDPDDATTAPSVGAAIVDRLVSDPAGRAHLIEVGASLSTAGGAS